MQIEKIVETPLGEADAIKIFTFFFKPHPTGRDSSLFFLFLFIFFCAGPFSGCCIVVVVGGGVG